MQEGRAVGPTEAQADSCGMIAVLVSDFSVDVAMGGGSLAAVPLSIHTMRGEMHKPQETADVSVEVASGVLGGFGFAGLPRLPPWPARRSPRPVRPGSPPPAPENRTSPLNSLIVFPREIC